MADSVHTSATLLACIRDPGNHDAWERFAAFYEPLIRRYARLHGCHAAMVRDVAQETLVDLIRIMPTFQYDPSRGRFRSFLYQIVRRRVQIAKRRQHRYVPVDPHDLAVHLPPGESDDQFWEREWQRQVLSQAMAQLRLRVTPRSFEAFEASAVHGEETASICARLGIEPNALHQIRSRLFGALREIARGIEAEFEEAHER